MLKTPMPRRAPFAAIAAAALLTSGCPNSETVTFSPLAPVLSPYSEVTIEIDYENRQIRATPDPVIIWFESTNPRSQILWTVRCVKGAGKHLDDVTCPDDSTVIIRPKEGCSKSLFGATQGAPAGEIRIQAPFNAVASGEPDAEEAQALFAAERSAETACDGSSKVEAEPMELSQSVSDIKWVYEIEVRRPGLEPFVLDPVTWIESDG